MAITYLKRATRTAETGQGDVRAGVEALLHRIDTGGEDAVRALSQEMDHWDGPIVSGVLVRFCLRLAAMVRLLLPRAPAAHGFVLDRLAQPGVGDVLDRE